MVTCDFCGTRNMQGNYVNDVIANISLTSGHWNPAKNEKTGSQTKHIFKGQACEQCFNKLAVLLQSEAAMAIARAAKGEPT